MMTQLGVILLCCLQFASLLIAAPTSDDFQTKLVFGDMKTLKMTTYSIGHMESDLYVNGNILFSWGSALKTLSSTSKEITLLSGSIDTTGYASGDTTTARYNEIANFKQTDKDTIMIVDKGNHCLRFFERSTNTTSSKTIGSCGRSGNTDGAAPLFNNPRFIIQDLRYPDKHKFILIDHGNSAIKEIDLNSGFAQTIVKTNSVAQWPFSAVFDSSSTDVLYITAPYIVMKLTLSTKTLAKLAGGQRTDSFRDGGFLQACFDYSLFSIIHIGSKHLVVADYWNHRVRILNLEKQTVRSLCGAGIGHSIGTAETCELTNPHALLYEDGKLFVGENGRFRFANVTLEEAYGNDTETFSNVCQPRNVSAVIAEGESTAEVVLGAGHVLRLEAGEHEVLTSEGGVHCTVHISVTGGDDNDHLCPDVIRRVASPETGKAPVDLAMNGIIQRMELPIGTHRYYIKTRRLTCNVTIDIQDPDLQRRLVFEARYNLSCAKLTEENTNTILISMIRSNAIFIKEICDGKCAPQPGSEPLIMCKDDIMTVQYSTDVVYQADMTFIPHKLNEQLVSSLAKKGSILSIAVITQVPPVVFPIRNADGSSATSMLTSYCISGRDYDAKMDRCSSIQLSTN